MNRRKAKAQCQPKRIQELNGLEVWIGYPRGKKDLVLVIPLRDGYPAQLNNALSARIRADLYGRCLCGARFTAHASLPGASGATTYGAISHREDCYASDGGLSELADRFGIPDLSALLEFRLDLVRTLLTQDARANPNVPLAIDLRDVPPEDRGEHLREMLGFLGFGTSKGQRHGE